MRRTLILILILIIFGLSFGGITRIYIWNRVGSEPFFENPETGTTTIPRWEYEHYLAKIDSLIFRGDIPAHDTLDWNFGDTLPEYAMEMYDIIIGLFGWPGSGSPGLTTEEDMFLANFLESNIMEIGGQRAVLLEGNDFARRYCFPGSPYLIKNYLCVEYLGTTPPPDSIKGVMGTFSQHLKFEYARGTGGPDTLSDDIAIYYPPEWSSHANFSFNLDAKSPARGILRSSYSPGACQLITFCFGNLKNGSYPNTKEELLKRMLDYAIPPLGWLLDDYTDTILYVDSLYYVRYTHYDNFLVKQLTLKYSTDNGATWNILYNVGFPTDSDTLLPWIVPPAPSDSCLLSIEVSDEAFNFFADTSGMFKIVSAVEIDGGKNHLTPKNWLSPAYPNPFNSRTTFRAILEDGGTINIFDVSGKVVRTLFVGSTRRQGSMFSWDGKDDNGEQLPAGVYFIVARSGNWQKAINLLMVK